LNDEIDFLEIEFTTITNIHNKHSLQLNQTVNINIVSLIELNPILATTINQPTK